MRLISGLCWGTLVWGGALWGGCATSANGPVDQQAAEGDGTPNTAVQPNERGGADTPIIMPVQEDSGTSVTPERPPANIGTETKCDGVDDNNNGVIDDVDLGKDGVCDCLSIATLGAARSWGGSNSTFATWLEARSSKPVLHLPETTKLSPQALLGVQVLIIQDLSIRKSSSGQYPGIGSDEASMLAAWVQAGGGVMTMAGYSDRDQEIINTNTLLSPFGLEYNTKCAGCAGAGVLGGGTPPVKVTGWSANHPIGAGLTMAGVNYAYPVKGDGDIVLNARPVSGGSPYVMAQAKQVTHGRVFAWGDEWITYDVTWKENPELQLQRLWLNIVKWLSPANECQVPIPDVIR